MADAYEEIQRIPILHVLDKLELSYTREGSDYVILKDGKPTRWKANIVGNYVNDFSHDRSKGGPWPFVKSYLVLKDKEVFAWYVEHFGIEGDFKPKCRTKIKKLYKPKIVYNQSF